jgi:hypothetical protein
MTSALFSLFVSTITKKIMFTIMFSVHRGKSRILSATLLALPSIRIPTQNTALDKTLPRLPIIIMLRLVKYYVGPVEYTFTSFHVKSVAFPKKREKKLSTNLNISKTSKK